MFMSRGFPKTSVFGKESLYLEEKADSWPLTKPKSSPHNRDFLHIYAKKLQAQQAASTLLSLKV
jgi:hypothetical protein